MHPPIANPTPATALAAALATRRPWQRAGSWLAGGSTADLPERVRRELDELRRRNEILVGWIQAGLVLAFALLYGFSRKTFMADVMLHPVPWALGVYTAVVAYRLRLAYTNRLTVWRQILSVFADMRC